MGFEHSFSISSGLVKGLKANEKYYLSPEYQEVDVCGNFIDKFFTALGWDVIHDIQPYLQKKCDLIDKQIDEFVNQFTCRSLFNEGRLYGLTEEEIRKFYLIPKGI